MISISNTMVDNASEQELLELVEKLLSDALKTMKTQEGVDIRYQAGLAVGQLGHAESLLRTYLKKKYKKDVEVLL